MSAPLPRAPMVVGSVLAVLAAVVAGLLVVAVLHTGPSGAAAASERRATATSTPTPTATPTPAPPAVVIRHPARVVTIGDSIMAGLGLRQGQAWPDVIAARDGVAIDNLGCSGAGFVAVGDCGSAYAGLVARAVADQPQVVVIQSSDNDLDEDPAAVASATAATVATLHQDLPSAVIVGFSTLWDQPEDAPAGIAAGSADLAQAVQSVGGVPIDLGQPLRGVPGMLQSDDEHPTAAGQQALATTITAALLHEGIAV